jgi:hypothetical protein
MYAYCENNPINAIDPLGLKTCWKNVIMTSFGDLKSDKVGTKDNKLKIGDIAVGHLGTGQHPTKDDKWSLPFGTKVNGYPDGSRNVNKWTVSDVGAYDKKHPDKAGPGDWIDIWDPVKSKKGLTTKGWISIEVEDCRACPLGWQG